MVDHHYLSDIRSFLIILSLFVSNVIIAKEVTPRKNDNGKWSLCDATGNEITKPLYTIIEPIDDVYFRVAIGGKNQDGEISGAKWGIINREGHQVLKNEYDQIDDIFNGLALIRKNNKYGFANQSWELVIEPLYDFVGEPNEQGYVWVNIGANHAKDHKEYIRDGKYGILDVNGKVIIPVEYKSIGTFSIKKSEYSQATIQDTKSDIERLMLECGSHIVTWPKQIELRPGYMLPTSVGFAFSKKNSLGENGVADLDGNTLVPDGLYRKCAFPSDERALVTTKSGSVGYHSLEDNSFIRCPNIKSAFAFTNGIAVCIDIRNKWGLYDISMNPISDSFDWISPKIGKYYIIKSANKMYLLNASNFTTIFEAAYIFPPKCGYMAYKDIDTELWGFLDADGTITIPPKYQAAYSFFNSAALIKGEKGWGIIDSSMTERISPVWDNIIVPDSSPFINIWARSSDNKYRCIDWTSGLQAFNEVYDHVTNFKPLTSNQMYAIVKKDKYGCIDSKGNIIIPFQMPEESIAQQAIDYYIKKNIKQWQPIDSYRFNISLDQSRNIYKTNDIIPAQCWDF